MLNSEWSIDTQAGTPINPGVSGTHPYTRHQIYEHLYISLRALADAMQSQGHDRLYAPQLGAVWVYLRELDEELTLRPNHGKALSVREYRVATLVKQGLTSAQIAELLCVSAETVKTHRRNIRRKLGLTSNAQSLQIYLQDLVPETPVDLENEVVMG